MTLFDPVSNVATEGKNSRKNVVVEARVILV
jgi:hypothetical protein